MSEEIFIKTWMLVLGTIAFVATLSFIKRYLELRYEKRPPVAIDGLQHRLERIESAVEATAVEVERISEAHRFMAKLLTDRGSTGNPVAREERVITPH